MLSILGLAAAVLALGAAVVLAIFFASRKRGADEGALDRPR